MKKQTILASLFLVQMGFSAILWEGPQILNFSHKYETPRNLYTFSWSPVQSDKKVEYLVYLDNKNVLVKTETTFTIDLAQMNVIMGGFVKDKEYSWHLTARIVGTKEESSKSPTKMITFPKAVSVLPSNSTKASSNQIVISNNSIDLSGFSKVKTVKIHTLDGKVISESVPVGQSFSTESLPRGIFILSIEAEGFVSVVKFEK